MADLLIPPAAPPVFILTASRSGSTLLRFILDSHPALACPPETGLGLACGQLASTLGTLENSAAASRGPGEEVVASPDTAAVIRAAIEFGFGGYLRRRGKARWCDKSLDNVQYAGLLAQVFPDAKFICLYRHCMDVIASGVEACPWGLHRFGYDQFVARHPGNSVAAIADYWLLCAHMAMDFEQRYPERCHRVRYEDLVAEPERTAAGIFSFLEVESVPGITRTCFEREHEADGPSDEKIWFTGAVTGGSVGRGAVVPVGAFPPGMLPVLNHVLAALCYRPADEEWNTAVGPLDPRLPAAPASGAEPAAGTARPGAGHPELTTTAQAIDARIRSRSDAQRSAVSAYWPRLRRHHRGRRRPGLRRRPGRTAGPLAPGRERPARFRSGHGRRRRLRRGLHPRRHRHPRDLDIAAGRPGQPDHRDQRGPDPLRQLRGPAPGPHR